MVPSSLRSAGQAEAVTPQPQSGGGGRLSELRLGKPPAIRVRRTFYLWRLVAISYQLSVFSFQFSVL